MGYSVEGFCVAGAVDRPRRKDRDESHLTHSVDWTAESVLCKRVKFASMLDDTCITSPEPTCPICAARLAKLKRS